MTEKEKNRLSFFLWSGFGALVVWNVLSGSPAQPSTPAAGDVTATNPLAGSTITSAPVSPATTQVLASTGARMAQEYEMVSPATADMVASSTSLIEELGILL